MDISPGHRRRIILGLTLALLLSLVLVPPHPRLNPLLGEARAIENQRDPIACEAVGNNWTTCDNAFVSNDTYAYANQTGGVQFARPVADLSITNWSAEPPTGSNSSKINESTPDDAANYTHTLSPPSDGDDAEFGLSSISDPLTSAGHILRYRYRNGASAAGSDNMTVDVELRDGGTVIAHQSHYNIIDVAWVTRTLGLITAEADGITDYTNLRARFNVTYNNTHVQNRRFDLTWVEFETPNPPNPGFNDTLWRNFGYGLNATDSIESVEVGVEWFRDSSKPILNVTVSWDGGATWAPIQLATNKSVDDNTLEWLDFTSATDWDASKLADTNFRVRLNTNWSGAQVDYVTVRVNFNRAPAGSDLRILDTTWQPKTGGLLDVNTEYRFVFNVIDEDGWDDIGLDGSVSLRLWYDGNVEPELSFADQSNGSNFRIELRYVDLSDPGTASPSEWSVQEGSASYNASASSAVPITIGPTLVGYEFNLSLMLGFHVKAAADPSNESSGGYNDVDSWNVEVQATDGTGTAVLRTAPAGQHVEFGVQAIALLEFGAVSLDPVIQPPNATVFRVTLNNTGQADAALVWANLTLPAELNYITDTAGAIGGVRTGTDFEFAGLAPGVHQFDVTASAAGGVENGTQTTTNFAFLAVDAGGVPSNASSEDVVVVITNAELFITVQADVGTAGPGDLINLTGTVRNAGPAPALNVVVSAVIDVNVSYVMSSPTGSYDTDVRTLLWDLGPLNAGQQERLEWTVRVNLRVADTTELRSRAWANYSDVSGLSLPSPEDEAVTSVTAPRFEVNLEILEGSTEAGDIVAATLTYNNLGQSLSTLFSADWDLGDSFARGTDSCDEDPEDRPGGFTVAFQNVTIGQHSCTVNLQVIRGLEDGFRMVVEVDWEATDANGNPFDDDDTSDVVTLDAPSISDVAVLQSPGEVSAGEAFLVELEVENVGHATANARINLTLPSGIEYIRTLGNVEAVRSDGVIAWLLPPIAANSSLTLTIEFASANEGGRFALEFILDYTDDVGSGPVVVRTSTSVLVRAPLSLLLWVIPIVAAAVIAVFLVGRRYLFGPKIEEVFVVHNSGILISHQSRTLTPDQDEDILAAMLKTVQDFVQDAFAGREDVPMKALEFERFNILIERGAHHYVAVVYQGKEDSVLKSRLSRLSKRIEEDYGDRLAAWTGDVRELRPIRKILPMLWGRRGLPGEEPMEEEGAFERLRHRIRGILSPVQRRVRGEEVPTMETLEDSPGATPEGGPDDLADVGPEPAHEEGQDSAPQGDAEEPGEEDEEE